MAINLEARLIFRGDSAIRALDRLEARMKKIDRVFSAADRSMHGLDRGLDSAARSGRSVSRTLDDVGSSAIRAERRVDRFNRTLRNTERRSRMLRGLGTVFSGFGRMSMGVLGELGSMGFGGLSGFSGGLFSGILGLLGSGISKLTNFIKSTLRTAFTGALVGAGGLAFASVKGLGIAAENEQAKISFETLLGSPEAAEQMIKDMYKFAEDTPFDIEGVRDSAKLLLAYGAPADELLTRLRSMGDAVAALGGDTNTMGRVALALGQIESKGKISAQEMNQLAESGIGAWAILSEELGLTIAELMKLGEQGKLLSENILPVLYRGMDRKFGGAMERQSRTLRGMYERMKEVLNNRLLMQWGEGIAQSIRPRLEWLTRWFDENEETTARWGEILEQTASQALDWVFTQFERVYGYINERYLNNPEFTELDFVGKVKFIFDDIKRTVNEWLNSGGRESIQKVADGFGEILGDGLAALTPTLTDIAANMGASFAQGFLAGIGENISDSLRGSALFSWSPGNQAEKYLKDSAKVREQYGIHVDDFDINNPNYDRLLGGSEAMIGKPQKKGWIQTQWDGLRHRVSQHIRGFSGGLSNVPYDNFPARLHKGERVLTAEENREYKKGGNGGININVQHMEVREEADIQRVAAGLLQLINEARANGA